MHAGTENEFARGFPVLAAAFTGMMFGLASVHTYTLGVLTPELCRAFGWKRTEVQASFAVLTFTFLAVAPIAGMLITRFGPRRILLTSLPLLGLTFMAFALVRGSLLQFYLTAALNAIVGAGTLPMAYARVITGWFPRRTGTALAVAALGPAVLGVVHIPIVMWLVGSYGWRAVYIVVGLMPLIVWPVVWIFLRTAPAADTLAISEKKAPAPSGYELRGALRHWRFWVMGLAFGLVAASVSGCLTNLPTLLADGGLTRGQIMLIAPVLGASGIAGRIAGGFLLDLLWGPAVAFAFLLVVAVGLLILSLPTLTPFQAFSALAMIGFAYGVENDLLAYMVSRYFGMRAYASIYGALFMFSGSGGGLSPVIFNLAHDATGSFDAVLKGDAGIVAIAALSLLTLGRYTHFAAPLEAGTASAFETSLHARSLDRGAAAKR